MTARYASIADLRAEGLDESHVPDERALGMLDLASRVIERLTGQRFAPLEETLVLDGDGGAVIHDPALLPVLETVSLKIGGEKVPESEFVTRDRLLSLRFGNFAAGRANVEWHAIFGWLDERRRVETALASPLAVGATSITVADAAGIRAGDALLVDGRIPLLVAEVEGMTIAFDPVSGGAAAGAKVVRYGRVPEPVRRACLLLALRARDGLATPEAEGRRRTERMIEERSDNYRYRLAEPLASHPGASSGDEEADRLLADYVAPPYVGIV